MSEMLAVAYQGLWPASPFLEQKLTQQCSHDDICTTCDKLALANHEKHMLSFSGCIRTRIVEVNVFEACRFCGT